MSTLYKVLSKDGTPCHGGTGTWFLPKGFRSGKWMPKISPVVPCRSGYHLCREADLVHWLGPVIYEAEGRGEMVEHEHKVVFDQARLLRRNPHWDETTARLFVADCAEDVLPIYEQWGESDAPRKAIEAARSFARGEIGRDELRAAGDAALAAAWAAGDAFAAQDAQHAARAAARAAAWAAGRNAWAAARVSARASQTGRLMAYLRGELS